LLLRQNHGTISSNDAANFPAPDHFNLHSTRPDIEDYILRWFYLSKENRMSAIHAIHAASVAANS
jgi:hypothetical protein